MARRALVLALLASLAAPAAAPAADETLTPRVDALRTGYVAGSPLEPPLRLRWQANLGQVASVPVVTAGKVVYVRNPGTGRSITALDAATGATAWDVPLAGSAYPELSAADGRLLVSAAEWLYVLDLQTGRELWRKRYETGYPEGYASSYAVGRDGVVYAIRDTGTATLYALRGSDGAQLWTARIISGTSTGPTVDDTTVYVVQGAGVVQAFDRATGAERWAYRTCCTGGGGGFGVRTGGVLLASASEPVAHDVRNGQVVGGFTGGLPHVTPSLLVHPMSNGVRATGHDGSPRWTWSPDPYAQLGVATVTPGAVVVTAEDGVLTLDPASGRPTWCAAPVAPPGSGTFPQLGGVAAGQGLLVVGFGYGLFAFENGGTEAGCEPVAPPPPPAPATTGSGSGSVALRAGRTDLLLGERTRLTGTAPPGATVRLQVDLHPFDDRWETGETLRAAADGTFAAFASPPRNLRIRAVAGEQASAPVTIWADFPATLRVLRGGSARPRLRFEVGALPGAKIRRRRVVFYLARRGQAEPRRIAAKRWQVRAKRFVRVTHTYPRGSLRRTDRWLVCTREPPGGDGFGRPSPLDALCGAPRLPLSVLRR
jgi:outer membrane protein assembly factor BamB